MTAHLPTLAEIEAAAEVVYRSFQATPQYRWATLSARLGTDCWVKHENHTPVGAFKIRGGLVFFDGLMARVAAGEQLDHGGRRVGKLAVCGAHGALADGDR